MTGVTGNHPRYKRRRSLSRAAAASILLTVALLGFFSERWVARRLPGKALKAAPETTEPTPEPARPVYPYSVIPGGVGSPEELRASLDLDPLVAAHYSGFQVERAVLVRTREDRYSYVSYRSGGKIYWTSYRVRIPAKELLVTDGRNYSRTRCGNRLSDIPQQPTLARNEPVEEALLYIPPPVSQKLLVYPGEMEMAPDLHLRPETVAFPAAGPAYAPVPSTPVPPVYSTLPGTGLAPPRSRAFIPPRGNLVPSPTGTPEPASLVLVGSVLLAAAALRRKIGR